MEQRRQHHPEGEPRLLGREGQDRQLVFRWSTEGAQRLLELQSGTVDGIDNPIARRLRQDRGDTDLKLYPREALNVFYLGMNNTMTPFDNEKVRQAIAMGIDRQRSWTTSTRRDRSWPHFTPCAIPGGCEGDEWYKFDPTAAKKLLADAGFPDGFEIDAVLP